jgi:flavin-dependent dehydrogenase
MLHRTLATQPDVLIVGGGPAGLACAIASARQGLHVEVIDARKPPLDKACGEGLLPGALESLSALGFDLRHDLDPTETAPLHGVRFMGDSSSNHYTTVQCIFPAGPGHGIRRTALHKLLLDRATSLGVRFHWENTLRSLTIDNTTAVVHTNCQTLHARYLIGADGHHSRVATFAGLNAGTTYSRRIGIRQHYAIAPWSRFVEVHWSNHGQAYVTPISTTEICVAFVAREKMASPDEALHHFPALQRHLASAHTSDTPRGSITLGRTLQRVTSGNVALIGDASGSVDAITGEGIALSFRQAAALSAALKANNLASYQQAHRRILHLPTIMSRGLLLMDRSPSIRDHALSLFQHNPWLFQRLLRIHISHSAPLSPKQKPCSNPTSPVDKPDSQTASIPHKRHGPSVLPLQHPAPPCKLGLPTEELDPT